MVRGRGSDELELEFVARGGDVQVGDLIITSGLYLALWLLVLGALSVGHGFAATAIQRVVTSAPSALPPPIVKKSLIESQPKPGGQPPASPV